MTTLSNMLEHCRHKLWMYVALEDVDISKAKEEHMKKIIKENKEIEADLGTLKVIGKAVPFLVPHPFHAHLKSVCMFPGEAASRLHCPHKDLDDEARQLVNQLSRQLAERQSADTQQSMYVDLSVSTSDGLETISLIFDSADRRTQWEEAFSDLKEKLGKQ